MDVEEVEDNRRKLSEYYVSNCPCSQGKSSSNGRLRCFCGQSSHHWTKQQLSNVINEYLHPSDNTIDGRQTHDSQQQYDFFTDSDIAKARRSKTAVELSTETVFLPLQPGSEKEIVTHNDDHRRWSMPATATIAGDHHHHHHLQQQQYGRKQMQNYQQKTKSHSAVGNFSRHDATAVDYKPIRVLTANEASVYDNRTLSAMDYNILNSNYTRNNYEQDWTLLQNGNGTNFPIHGGNQNWKMTPNGYAGFVGYSNETSVANNKLLEEIEEASEEYNSSMKKLLKVSKKTRPRAFNRDSFD